MSTNDKSPESPAPSASRCYVALDSDRPYPEGIAFDEAWRQRQRADRAERIVREIWETFYGQNLQVANWHLNGELEPMDKFFESNDWSVD